MSLKQLVHGALSLCLMFVWMQPAASQLFVDDFERADGPVDGWTAVNGPWMIQSGQAVAGPPNGPDMYLFGGDPAQVLPENYRLSFDVDPIEPSQVGDIGRHFGVFFNFDAATHRGAGSGYGVWWIDRAGDKGFNLTRRDAGGFNHLVVGPGAGNAPADPPTRWTIERVGDRIKVFGDGVLYIDHIDGTYKGGRFGLWCWEGAPQVVGFDNVVVEGVILSDDFERSAIPGFDGSGSWRLDAGSETLQNGPTGGDEWLFHTTEVPEEFEFSLDMSYLGPGRNVVVGRHAGPLFCYQGVGNRNGSGGYQLFWIDRAADFGLNLVRWDGGALVGIHTTGTGDTFPEPPANLRVEVDGPTIRVFGDDVMAFEYDDDTYRGGLTGVWCWGAENKIQVDNYLVTAGGQTIIEEDFTPGPPPLSPWTEIPDGGNWEIVTPEGEGARLRAGPPSGPPQSIFADPLLPASEWTANVDINWLAPADGGPPVGRHGGVLFNWSPPSQREVGSGYHLWWIDRAADRGWNLYKIVNGAGAPVASGNTPDNSPNGTLTIERSGDDIIVSQNGQPVLTHTDGDFKGGQFGLWTWEGGGQQVDFDNVTIFGTPVAVSACFEITSDVALATGNTITFDANCTFGEVDAFTWDFGDGNGGTGSIIDHSYDNPGTYTVTLTADGGLTSDTLEMEVTIAEQKSYDCDGVAASDDLSGDLADWVADGDWRIEDGRVAIGPTNAENELFWAHNLPNDQVIIQFDFEQLGGTPPPDIGRHLGALFCYNAEGDRGAGNTSGYQVWWIDRGFDYGLNLARWDGGGLNHIHVGTHGLLPQPPTTIRIEIFGDNIKIYGDDILAIDLDDGTHRGGRFAFWAYSNAQSGFFDNFCVDGPPISPCIEVAGDCQPPVAGADLTFDASCTTFLIDGDGATYSWDFGDGNDGDGPSVIHSFADPGSYEVTLTVDVDGQSESTTRTVAVAELAASYENTFDGDDLSGLTVVGNGGWRVQDGVLANGPTGPNGEEFIFMGSPALVALPESTYEYDFDFTVPGDVAAIGRHAGFQFCCDRVAPRGAFSGYFIDWIDRVNDRGVRLSRVDNGAFVELQNQVLEDSPVDPPTSWRVETTPTHVRVWGDDVLYFDLADATYRGGYFGFWSWVGGQQFTCDNLFVEATSTGATPCFDCTAPGTVFLGEEIGFDASCTDDLCGVFDIASYEWDFGDGNTDSGVSVAHTYGAVGTYTVTLTITDGDDNETTTTKEVTIAEEGLPFVDCMEAPRGALVDWTTFGSTWLTFGNGTGGTATTADSGSIAYFGSPAGATAAESLSLQFDVIQATAAVGDADLGAVFYASSLATDFGAPNASGYAARWSKQGFTTGVFLVRLDNGVPTVLANAAPAGGEPTGNWKIECDAANIRVLIDDVEIINVADSTYRRGHAGLFAGVNMSLGVDNVRIGTGGVYPDCPSSGGIQKPCDFNQDGNFDLSDAVGVLNHLFLGGSGPACGDGTLAHPANIALLDANGSGAVDLSDAIYKLNYLFTGGPPPVLGEDCVEIEGCDEDRCAP